MHLWLQSKQKYKSRNTYNITTLQMGSQHPRSGVISTLFMALPLVEKWPGGHIQAVWEFACKWKANVEGFVSCNGGGEVCSLGGLPWCLQLLLQTHGWHRLNRFTLCSTDVSERSGIYLCVKGAFQPHQCLRYISQSLTALFIKHFIQISDKKICMGLNVTPKWYLKTYSYS